MLKYTIVLSFISLGAYAQQVVATSGDTYKSSSAIVSWTLGEPATETHKSSNSIATQGMQQPTLSVVTSYSTTELNVNVFVYPNPTSSSLQVSIQEQSLEHLAYSLCDVNGIQITAGLISNATSWINMETQPAGSYILKITKSDKEQKSFKIIKQ